MSGLFENMENLKIISSFHKKSKGYAKINNRAHHSFIIRIKGSGEYFFENRSVKVAEGEMIFVPAGSSYTKTAEGEKLYTSINFQANLDDLHPKVYSLNDFYGANFIYESFSELWNFGTQSDKYKCISVFYDLMSYVSKIEHLGNRNKKKYSLIEPAADYLKKHIYDSSLRVEDLHKLCGISDTYFRKIFISRFNMSPQKYLVTERISHAKSIIESGDYDTIKEVAETVGYNDSLYFSKAFRKITGVSPSDVNK